jgi:molybdopterin-dependent oxidoreductase alpha subunit
MHPVVRHGGGIHAIIYTMRMAKRVGLLRLWSALRTKNACKTCALGMGGQRGGMVNELGHFPEVCKKSLQAMVSDMQGQIREPFFQQYPVEHLKSFTPKMMEDAGRISFPVILREGAKKYEQISWDEANAKISRKLESVEPEEMFFYSSGRSSNEAGFLVQILARALGTNHVNNCSYYCHQASGVALNQAIGTGTATLSLESIESSDLVFLIGANPSSNHPRLMSSLTRLRRRGGKIVVINPIRETGLVRFKVPSDWRSMLFGGEIATHYVQPHIGGDIPLMIGVAKYLLAKGQFEREFCEHQGEDFSAYRALVQSSSWVEIERDSGVKRADIEMIAAVYGESKAAVFSWTMGITHHLHGVENVRHIVNLALMRKMIGKDGAGLLPIRGHSNVQGMGTVGVAPLLKPEVAELITKRLGISIPTMHGLDTMGCMDASSEGKVKFALCHGGNLFGSNPDAKYAAQAMSKIDLVVYMNTTLNTGHAQGLGRETIILPVKARDEESQATSQESMFNWVRFSSGGKSRITDARSEVDVFVDIGSSLQLPTVQKIPWHAMKDFQRVRGLIASVIPELSNLDSNGKLMNEFEIEGRLFKNKHTKLDSGKAKFSAENPASLKRSADGKELTMMTIRSEGQFNTVVYEEEDRYRNQERRDIILMSREDIERHGLKVNDRVRVASQTGVMQGMLVREFDIRAGNAAMYAPEANILVGRAVDPQSKTPAFKAVKITVSRV